MGLDLVKAHQSMDRPAFVFSISVEDGADMGSRPMACFLNIRNPKEKKPLDVFKTGLYTGTSGASKSILLQVMGRVKDIEKKCSKNVDENGEPLVVYDGSGQGFNGFNNGEGRKRSGATEGAIFASDIVTFSGEVEEAIDNQEEKKNIFAVPDGVVSAWAETLDNFLKYEEKLASANGVKFFMKVCDAPPILLKFGIANLPMMATS